MKLRVESIDDIELISYTSERDNLSLKKLYLSWLNDTSVTESIASPELNSKKDMSFVEESFVRFSQKDCKGFFIYYVPEKVFIGTTKLDSISPHNLSAWDGIMIGNKFFQGRGIAPKVYKILLSFAFDNLKLRRISSGCNSNNIAMIKTFLHIGYTREGCLRKADNIGGTFSDHLYFGILREEFFKKNHLNLIIEN